MKSILLSAFALLLINMNVFAQSVPNGGFESWNSTSFDEPNGWFTGNAHTAGKMGVAPVSKVTGQSGYALRIETIIMNGDTSDSYISNSAAGDPTKGEGGVPFSQQPTALTGYYRYNLPGDDSAAILVVFKKNTTIIGGGLYMIKGTGNQPTFAPFSFPLTVPIAPDTVIMAAASSNLVAGVGIQDGSFLELDGLSFTGASQTIPNGDFESWTPRTFDTPTGWMVSGDSIAKTADNYAGSYAIRLKTAMSQDGQTNPCFMTSGSWGNNGTIGGQPFSLNADTLVGYYKYFPSGTDSANVFVSVSAAGSPLGGGGNYLTAAATYTYFEVPFSAFSTPDTMRIDIASSSFNSPVIGSTLYLDGLTLKSVLTGMNAVTEAPAILKAYPNPASDMITLELNHRAASWLITIYDMSGRKVMESVRIMSGRTTLPVSDLQRGIYTVQLSCGNESFRSVFAKE